MGDVSQVWQWIIGILVGLAGFLGKRQLDEHDRQLVALVAEVDALRRLTGDLAVANAGIGARLTNIEGMLRDLRDDVRAQMRPNSDHRAGAHG